MSGSADGVPSIPTRLSEAPSIGAPFVTATALTPGNARTLTSTARKNCAAFAPSSALTRWESVSVSRWRASKPGSVWLRFRKLRIKRPAPTSSMSDSATSATTSVERTRLRAAPSAPERPPSLSATLNSGFDAWRAGASPNSTPVNSETPSVKNSTVRSRLMSAVVGMMPRLALRSAETPQKARSSPNVPPATPRMTLSVSN